MKIVGQVSTVEEAQEFEHIVKLFIINGRIKKLAYQSKKEPLTHGKRITDDLVFVFTNPA